MFLYIYINALSVCFCILQLWPFFFIAFIHGSHGHGLTRRNPEKPRKTPRIGSTTGDIHSGKHTKNYGKIHHAINGKIHYKYGHVQ